MLTHHQTQSVTMLQPILTVAPSPRQGKRISIRPSQRRRSLCERNLTFLSAPLPPPLSPPPPSDRDEQHQRGGWLGGVVPKPGGLSVPVGPPAEERNLHRRPPQAGGQLGPGRHEPLAGGGSQLFQQGLTSRQSSRVQMFHFVVFIRGRGAPNSCSRPRRRDTAMR